MRKMLTALAVAAAALVAFAPAYSQPSGQVQAVTPLTRDLGSLKTLTAQGPATVTTADQNGFNVSRIICVYRQATQTGSPSSTFTIQGKDAASSQYYTLIQSAAITTGVSTNVIAAGAGVTTTANVSAGLPVPKTWRVSLTMAGGGATITGTVGCSAQ